MILKTAIEKLMRKESLDEQTLEQAFDAILSENNIAQASAFLVLLRAKPETSEEFASLIKIFQRKMISVITPHRVMDIVGTGGDGQNTVNISTGSAILAASCGIKIAKHGNRAVSSKSGAADVLQALGVEINVSPEKVAQCIDEAGIGFCYAPNFHPRWGEFRPLRQQLGVQTTFNILGPLLNPACAAYFLLGIFNETLLPTIAKALQKTGMKRALVVHGCGLDEISCVGVTHAMEVTETEIKKITIDPESLGFSLCSLHDLKGADAKTNAALLTKVFSGEKNAIADTLILNAAAALWIYEKASSIAEAIPLVRKNLENGAALKTLKKWVEVSNG